MATGGEDSIITLWNLNYENKAFKSATKDKQIKYHTKAINHLDISVDDKLVSEDEKSCKNK